MNKELKAAIKVVNDMGEKLDAIIIVGKIQWVRLGFFLVGKIKSIVTMVKTADTWLDQYENLTEEGRADLMAWYAKDFDIANDVVELQIEKAVGQLMELVNSEFVKKLRALLKTISDLKKQ